MQEFESLFPRREAQLKIESIFPGDLTVDRDALITGIVKGTVIVREGVQAQIHGFVEGSVRVKPDA